MNFNGFENLESDDFSLDPENFTFSMDPQKSSQWNSKEVFQIKNTEDELIIQRVELPKISQELSEGEKLELIRTIVQSNEKEFTPVQSFTKSIFKNVVANTPSSELQSCLTNEGSRFNLLKRLIQENESQKQDFLRFIIEKHEKEFSDVFSMKGVVFRRVASNMSSQELRSCLNNKSDRLQLHKQITQANQNDLLFRELANVYGVSCVDRVFEKVDENIQSKILSGKVTFSQYFNQFESNCKKEYQNSLPDYNQQGDLLDEEQLAEFLSSAKCIDFKEGFQGVYIFEGKVADSDRVLVFKAALKPAQELFGTKLISALGAQVPATDFVSIQSHQGKVIAELLEKEAAQKNQQHPVKCEGFMVMEHIDGEVWENISKDSLAESSSNLGQILEDYGEIIVYDLLLHNSDRSPVIGMGNYDNLMLIRDKEGYSGLIAIDQAAHFTDAPYSLTPQLVEDPFDRVSTIIEDISLGAESTVVAEIQSSLDEYGFSDIFESENLGKHLLIGLNKGMKKIAKFSPITIDVIHDEVNKKVPTEKESKVYSVDAKAHKKMLLTIQNSINSEGFSKKLL